MRTRLARRALVVLGGAALLAGWVIAGAIDARIDRTPAVPAGAAAVLALELTPPPPPAPAPVPAPVAVAVAPAVDPDLLGRFRMTRYYVAEERGFARPRPAVAPEPDDDDDDDEVMLATGARGDGVTIYDDRGCRALATLGRRFTEVLDVQGTGRLRDGRVINVSGPCRCGHSPCYRPMASSARWGLSAKATPLQPFRSIAVDPEVIPLGSLVYVAELDGLTMPGQPPWGGFVHDGCLHATDVGGGVDGDHLDFFVGRFQYKKALDARKKMKHVTVYDGTRRCERRGSQVARRGAGI